MSMEAIEKVKAAEEAARRQKAQAALLAAADQRAAQARQALEAETAAQIRQMRRQGEDHLAEAVDFIVERVVKT